MEDKNIVEQQNVNTRYVINEGKAKILIVDKNVFYNPVQEFNRDLRYAEINIKINEFLRNEQCVIQ